MSPSGLAGLSRLARVRAGILPALHAQQYEAVQARKVLPGQRPRDRQRRRADPTPPAIARVGPQPCGRYTAGRVSTPATRRAFRAVPRASSTAVSCADVAIAMPGLDAPPLLTGAGADATQSWIVDVPSRRSSCGMVARARARCAVGWVVAAFGALHAHAAGPPAGSALVIRNAEIYDGRGGAPYRGEIAVTGDRIVAIGAMVSAAPGARVINARGLAVAPGFINVLSWAPDSLIVDGRGVSDIKQGVTLEIFGEGFSYGPLSKENRSEMLKRQGDIRYPITWTTLAEFLDFLVAKGVSPNVALSLIHI